MKLEVENLQNIVSRLSNPQAGLILLTATAISYGLLALMANSQLITSYLFSGNFNTLVQLASSLILSYPAATETLILATTLITATLIGLNIALLSQILTAEGATGGLTGTFLSLTVSGCAACTTGVISLAGASIGLGFLPYNGLEINLLGIGLLSYTALYVSNKDRQKICKI